MICFCMDATSETLPNIAFAIINRKEHTKDPKHKRLKICLTESQMLHRSIAFVMLHRSIAFVGDCERTSWSCERTPCWVARSWVNLCQARRCAGPQSLCLCLLVILVVVPSEYWECILPPSYSGPRVVVVVDVVAVVVLLVVVTLVAIGVGRAGVIIHGGNATFLPGG